MRRYRTTRQDSDHHLQRIRRTRSEYSGEVRLHTRAVPAIDLGEDVLPATSVRKYLTHLFVAERVPGLGEIGASPR